MIFIKHVRNKIKSQYTTEDECYICGAKDQLEFHHLKCLSVESQKLLRTRGKIKYPNEGDSDFDELVWFIAKHDEIINPEFFFTLCKTCHKELHSRYGQNYVAWKPVAKYIEKMRAKNNGK